MQALRLLVRAGRISRSVKDALILDMIDCVTDKRPSMAEQAYKMLVHAKGATGGGQLTTDVPDDVLEEFGEQCVLIADILNAEGEGSWNNAVPHEDEDEDDEDEEDEDGDEENEALIAALTGSLASSSPGAGGRDDDRDDDEEAVIEALAGSLK